MIARMNENTLQIQSDSTCTYIYYIFVRWSELFATFPRYTKFIMGFDIEAKNLHSRVTLLIMVPLCKFDVNIPRY